MIQANQFIVEPEWEKLEHTVRGINPTTTKMSHISKSGHLTLGIDTLYPHPGFSFLAAGYASDTFIVLSAHHKNEQKNFHDKVYKAIANLRKHTVRDENAANVIFIKLHPTASIKEIRKYANEVLGDETLDSPIDGLFLYQTSVTRKDGQSSVSHHTQLVLRKNSPLSKRPPVLFAAYIGIPSSEPSRLELHLSEQKINLDGNYIYQAGDHYYEAQSSNTGHIGNAASIAPGILAHAVFRHPVPGFVVQGKFPKDEELTIL